MFTIGADVECFLGYKGSPISAIGLLADKDHPLIEDGFAYHSDNVTAEYAIPYVSDREGFLYNLLHAQARLFELTGGLDLNHVSIMEFTESDLSHPLAQESGCQPEYILHKGRPVIRSKPRLEKTNTRVAGGHIHVGIQDYRMSGKDMIRLVQLLDEELYPLAVALDPNLKVREMYYGGISAFRPKPYGIEYRALSNFWCSSTEYMLIIYDAVKNCVDKL